MESQQVQSIVLSVLPYEDFDRIGTVFTRENGLIKLFLKGANRPKSPYHGLFSPLAALEVVYQPKRSGLHRFLEARAIDTHPRLRQDLDHLEAACELLQAVQATQFQGKPAPRLYDLLAYYLQRMVEAKDPQVLLDSFRLKLLLHDGHWQPPQRCVHCGDNLDKEARWNGQGWYCLEHADESQSLHFQDEEMSYLFVVTATRSFKDLKDLESTSDCSEKIDHLFSYFV